MLSLMQQKTRGFDDVGGGGVMAHHASDWSMDELCGVCSLLKIPFVVIVQSHLLRDKGAVRLRRIVFDAIGTTTTGNETFVELERLASTISAMTLEGSTGVGVGLVPRSALVDHEGTPRVDLVVIDLDEPWAERNLQLCVRNTDALNSFAKHLLMHLVAE